MFMYYYRHHYRILKCTVLEHYFSVLAAREVNVCETTPFTVGIRTVFLSQCKKTGIYFKFFDSD